MTEFLMITLFIISIISLVVAATSLLKVHFDNIRFAKDETSRRCNYDDYKYCDKLGK